MYFVELYVFFIETKFYLCSVFIMLYTYTISKLDEV